MNNNFNKNNNNINKKKAKHTTDYFTPKELAKQSFLLTWENLKNKNYDRIILGFTQNKSYGMYLGVKEAIEELEIKTEIYTLEDIKNTFNPKLKIRDFFKIEKEFLKNSLIFDNLPYNLTITIIEYILKLNKLKYNINFALACAGFTGNSFINKYDLLYIYLANARFYDKNGKNEHIFPTIILTNNIDKLTSNQKKKTNSQKIEVFRNKKILSTTDVFSLLKYFDIKKENIIKLSNEFYGGIKIKGFNDIVCK